jgi:hypothetical protein
MGMFRSALFVMPVLLATSSAALGEHRMISIGDPPKDLVEKALDKIIQAARVAFADELEQAIMFFRKYPDLVKRGKLPDEFRAAYVREYNK